MGARPGFYLHFFSLNLSPSTNHLIDSQIQWLEHTLHDGSNKTTPFRVPILGTKSLYGNGYREIDKSEENGHGRDEREGERTLTFYCTVIALNCSKPQLYFLREKETLKTQIVCSYLILCKQMIEFF